MEPLGTSVYKYRNNFSYEDKLRKCRPNPDRIEFSRKFYEVILLAYLSVWLWNKKIFKIIIVWQFVKFAEILQVVSMESIDICEVIKYFHIKDLSSPSYTAT